MDQHHHTEASSTARIHTHPELRRRLREEILAGSLGGAPGKWSPAKAQLLRQQYRQAGGGYTFAKRPTAAPQLQDWPGASELLSRGAGGELPRLDQAGQ